MLLPEYPEPEIIISVSKVGGGTLGKSYKGSWEYRVSIRGLPEYVPPMLGDDLTTGTPKTHAQVAQIIAGYLSSGEYDWVPEDQHDRLSVFAGDQ